MGTPLSRRGFLAASGAVAAVRSVRADQPVVPAVPPPREPLVELPRGTIGAASISRVLLGGNLIAGYMHSRDLKYVNNLFRAYATDGKILDTLELAERCGINTVFETGAEFVARYNRERGGTMQFIPHIEVRTGQPRAELLDHIKAQIDLGGVALYVWGVSADTLVRDGDLRQLALAVELAKGFGLPVGVGAHSLEVPRACEAHGVPCDFYVKTLHADDYPSAWPKAQRRDFAWLDDSPAPGWYDNMWCIDPEETIAFMRSVAKPWIAFKILAAGAIPPLQAFPHAFKNGADFVAVGMIDFQVKANCELAARTLRRYKDRERPWRG